MSNRISIVPIHGIPGGTNSPCVVCGSKFCLVDYAEATDHAVGKKYTFGIESCQCGRILNIKDLKGLLPKDVFQEIINQLKNT